MAKSNKSYLVRRNKKYLIERTAQGTFARWIPTAKKVAKKSGKRSSKKTK